MIYSFDWQNSFTSSLNQADASVSVILVILSYLLPCMPVTIFFSQPFSSLSLVLWVLSAIMCSGHSIQLIWNMTGMRAEPGHGRKAVHLSACCQRHAYCNSAFISSNTHKTSFYLKIKKIVFMLARLDLTEMCWGKILYVCKQDSDYIVMVCFLFFFYIFISVTRGSYHRNYRQIHPKCLLVLADAFVESDMHLIWAD